MERHPEKVGATTRKDTAMLDLTRLLNAWAFIETLFQSAAGKGSKENWHHSQSSGSSAQVSAALGYFEIKDDKSTDTEALREELKKKYRRLRYVSTALR